MVSLTSRGYLPVDDRQPETFLILPASCGTNQPYLRLGVTPNRPKPMVIKID
jgi:hypothetical protein